MTEYSGVRGETSREKVIEKSRFLTYAVRVCGEEEAKKYLSSLRAAHPFSTHVCYGFVADAEGNMQRFSDDGEPQGTAGMPILGVLKARELRESLVAVVRYFGGVKLGAGGLTRAYAGCASECLASAEICTFARCAEITVEVGYSEVNAALRFLEGEEIIAREFGQGARFTLAVRESDEEEFSRRAVNYFNGNVRLTAGKRYFYPFTRSSL